MVQALTGKNREVAGGKANSGQKLEIPAKRN